MQNKMCLQLWWQLYSALRSHIYLLAPGLTLTFLVVQGDSRAAKRSRVKGAPRRAVKKSQGIAGLLCQYHTPWQRLEPCMLLQMTRQSRI